MGGGKRAERESCREGEVPASNVPEALLVPSPLEYILRIHPEPIGSHLLETRAQGVRENLGCVLAPTSWKPPRYLRKDIELGSKKVYWGGGSTSFTVSVKWMRICDPKHQISFLITGRQGSKRAGFEEEDGIDNPQTILMALQLNAS